MDISFILGFLMIGIFIVVTLYIFINSRHWEKADATILKSEIKTVHYPVNSSYGDTGNRFGYKLQLLYEYEYEGRDYKGSSLYAGFFLNLLSNYALAEESANRYSVGTVTSVFVNPKRPSQSALNTSASISIGGIIAFCFFVLFVFLIILGAYYFIEIS